MGVTDSPVRATLKILLFGHFVMEQIDIVAIQDSGAENKDPIWAGQGRQAMAAESTLSPPPNNFNLVDI